MKHNKYLQNSSTITLHIQTKFKYSLTTTNLKKLIHVHVFLFSKEILAAVFSVKNNTSFHYLHFLIYINNKILFKTYTMHK